MANYRTSLNITSEGTYSVELNRWTATVQITTTSEDFYSHAITVKKDDAIIDTIYFSNAGSATYLAHESGAYKFVVNYNGEIYEVPVAIQNETTYPITINRWTANITISVDAAAFHGQYLAVTKGATSYGNILIDNNGEATYSAHEAGVYTFTLTYSAHESYTVNVSAPTDGGSYSGSITRWITTINLSTSSSEFVSSAIVITKDNVAYDTIYFSNSAATIDVHEQGTYKFTVTYSNQGTTEVYDSTVVVGPSDNGQTYNKSIDRWNHTFNLSTNSTDFASSTITVKKDGANYDSTTFSSGTATYVAHATGTYQFVVTINNTNYESATYTLSAGDDGGSTTVPAIDRWIANIGISTGSTELLSQTVTVYKGSTQIGTIVLASTVDTPVYYKVYDYDIGNYSFAIVWDGETYESDTVTVSAAGTYTATIDLLKLVAWSTGTDAEIQKMLNAYYAGKASLSDIKSVWSVGDSRQVSLSAMSATGVGESHRAQTVEMVILDFDHDTLATAINGKTKALITVQQKNCLRDATVADDGGSSNTEHGYMNDTNTNVGGWTSSKRRTWCNDVYYAALPSGFKAMVKEATHQTTAGNQSATMNTDTDKVFLPSEWEVFGATTNAKAQEGTQYKYYETAANRYKLPKWSSSYVSDAWWERSPYGSYATAFCRVARSGTANLDSASNAHGLAPACCL